MRDPEGTIDEETLLRQSVSGLGGNRTMTLADFMHERELQGGVELGNLSNAGLADVLRMERTERYEVGDIVAHGGMGSIVRVKDLNCRRNVAMKVMLPHAEARKENLVRFIEEAQVTSQLEHPNIVPVHELAVNASGSVFYTMKFVKGRTLAAIIEDLRKGKPEAIEHYSMNRLLNIFQRACDAVAFAHSRGVVHRDLKPSNIMLGDFGEVLVMDWGLVKLMERDGPVAPVRSGAPIADQSSREEDGEISGAAGTGTNETLESIRGDRATAEIVRTMEGAIMGTPAFMSPEQARGQVELVDQRSDVYSLGCILYNLLTLRQPVLGADVREVVANRQAGDIPAPESFNGQLPHCPGRSVPPSLAAVCRKALAADLRKRYAQVQDLQHDLEAWQGGYATSAENASWWQHCALLVKRHRTFVLSLSAVFLALLVGLLSALHSLRLRDIEEAKRIEQGKVSSPLFVELAEKMVLSDDLAGAATAVRAALELDPTSGAAVLQQGRLQLAAGQFADADDSFRHSRSLSEPGMAHDQATSYLAVTKMLTQWPVDPRRPEGIRILSAAATMLKRRGDLVLAARVLGQAGLGDDALALRLEAARSGLEKTNPGLNVPPERFENNNGEVALDLSGLSISDISVLTGLPLTRLSLAQTAVKDISALQDMPLDDLNLEGTKVVDFSVLEGLPLKKLKLWETEATDLSFLRGKRLTSLSLYGCRRVTDLDPIRGMPIQWLSLGRTMVSDLSPLSGMPLETLNICSTRVRDLGPLKGMRLRELNARTSRVVDLSPLGGIPLHSLDIGYTRVDDLSPLVGMRLSSLDIGHTRVHDLSPLVGMPLKTLVADSLNLPDRSPLAALPLAALHLHNVTPAVSVCELASIKTLSELVLSETARDMDCVKQLPNLKRLDFDKDGDVRTVEEFFHDYDKSLWTRAMLEKARERLGKANGVEISRERFVIAHSARGLDLSDLPISDLSALRGIPMNRLRLENTQVRDLGPLAGMPLQEIDLRGTQVEDIAPLKGMPLQQIDLQDLNVDDITPLKGMPLQKVNLAKTQVSDLAALKGAPLKELRIDETKVADLTPLAGMALEVLHLAKTLVTDLRPLQGMKLDRLDLYATPIKSLRGLEGMPLKELNVINLRIESFEPLRGMPLEDLGISGTPFANLEVLDGRELRELRMACTGLSEDYVDVLAGFPKLERVVIPSHWERIEPLRALPNLTHLATKYDGWRTTTAAFWASHDRLGTQP